MPGHRHHPPAGTTTGGGGTTTARPAAATASAGRSLALTGSDNGELAGAGALALLAGALLVRAGRQEEPAPTA
ncbi:MAG: LPXTG cell wall anchor domain-containing protein [Acidimicrobiales bacterium]|nr:LPXTG cell wall anchor domain-containing protein [Acidimicrobiales bacterium]